MNLRSLLVAVATLVAAATSSAYNFSLSQLQGVTLTASTSLQFGPDHRLYVSQVDGTIKALTIQRLGPNNYQVTATENIELVKNIPNYDDSGVRNFTLTKRQVTGILVVGTADNPIIYVSSSDPRIGGGSGGENDLNLDTNSGIISRLTRVNGVWTKLDLVRGLPRSEENHANNGLQLDPVTHTLYVAQGGNTNAGGPSINFAYMGETALSAAILSIDLDAIEAMPVKTDPYGQKYLYDLPTLDDPNPSRAHNPNGADVNDPFGGNDGLNQAKLVEGGPVQIYSPGWRNPYDLLITKTPGHEGRMYSFDNGANVGWGGYPMNEGPQGNVTNQYVEGEPGQVNDKDGLYRVTPGFYRGHPNPLRANPAGAGWFHFDSSQPPGSQKIFSPNPTSDWPAVPVSMANPVEGDFRLPGVADGALLTYTESTNGLAEYVATNFGGEMQGNLIAAGYDGKILRIALSADGNSVTNGVEFLATGFGNLPLDVTTPDPGHGAAFVGTIWVVHYSPAKITILEPEDFDSPGGSNCTGIDSFDVDEDGDGFSNADEIDNNSDPCSGAIRPPDIDGDNLSDLNDPDDDNDGIPDLQDRFPVDPFNGINLATPLHHELFNDYGVGFYGVGFTGLMMNPGQDYLTRRSPDNIIAGGTAGLFTIAHAGTGTPRGAANSQMDAYHFGIPSNAYTAPYLVGIRLAGPFFSSTPTGSQRQGVYVGHGDQDNYVSVALHANNGAGAIEVVHESTGTIVAETLFPFPELNEASTVDVFFQIDPIAGTILPLYQLEGETALTALGAPIAVSDSLLAAVAGPDPIAIGAFANRASGDPAFPATFDFFDVAPISSTAIAKITVDPTGSNMATSSTFNTGSFKIENLSTGGQQITNVHIDISTSVLPDLVFDTNGAAGDPVAKNFTPNSATGGVVLANGGATQPHNGVDADDGFDAVAMTFSAFPVNGLFTFSIDIDPNNVKGVAQPGERDSASVSGLELAGATATVTFNDGSTFRTRLGRVENSVDGSYGWARADKPPQPVLAIVGNVSPFTTNQATQTVRVFGPPGLNVSLVILESGLYLVGVPSGGYNVQPYDTNTIIKVTELAAVIAEPGYVDIPVTLTQTEPKAGYNLIAATFSSGGIKGPTSSTLLARYDPSFTGGDTQPPTAPGNLAASSVTSRSVSLSWSASSDNVGVVAYDVLRNGSIVTTVFGLNYTDIGLDSGVTVNYSVVARDQVGNTSPAATTSATTVSKGSVALRVNVGGPSFVDSFGATWAADNGSNTGMTSSTSQSIDRTIDDTVFKTRRLDSQAAAPDLIYSFNVPNGDYEVQLLFAENDTGNAAVGKRVFDISLEGTLALDNFDIFASAGAPFTAVIATATTSVADGQLNIHFGRVTGNPQVNAIKVIALPPAETEPPTTPANLHTVNITASTISLEWDEATDNVGVTGYTISRDGVLLQTISGLSFTDTGLAASTTYNYEVSARDAAGNLSVPATLSATTLEPVGDDTEPPSAPGPLVFSSITATGVTLSWTAATDNVGVTGYQISRDGVLLTTVDSLTFTDTGLSPDTEYSYSVVAVDAVNNASVPSSGTVTTSEVPTPDAIRINAGGSTYVDSFGNTWAADTGYNTGTAKVWPDTLTVSGTSDPVLFRSERYDPAPSPDLSYTVNVPNGNYLVRLHMAETFASTSGPGLRVFDIDIQGARAFEDVDIFVRAGGANQAVVLEKSVTVSSDQLTIAFLHQVENPKVNAIEIVPTGGTPADTEPPTQPGPLSFTGVSSTSVTVNWTASTDNVGVTGYRVFRDGAQIAAVATLSFTDSSAASDTTYSYSVVAVDAAGNTSLARTDSVTTDPAPPDPDFALRINAGGPAYVDSAGNTWSADTGYNTGKVSSDSATVVGTSDPQLFKTLRFDDIAAPHLVYAFNVPNGNYLVRLHLAETSGANKAPGKRIFDVDIQDLRAFEDVDIFVLAGGGNKALVLESEAEVTNGQIAIKLIPQVNVSRIHALEILSIDEGGGSDTEPPSAPGALTFTDVAANSVTLQWPAATDNVGVTGYIVSRDGNPLETVTTTSYVDATVSPSTSYSYSVVAFDAADNVSPASTGNVATPAATDTQPPTAPGALTFTNVAANSVTLQWPAATDNVGVTGYIVSRDGNPLETVTTTSYVDATVAPSTSYSYSVVAFDAADNVSPASTGNVATPAATDTQPPTAPGALVFSNVEPTSVTVAWPAATDNVGVDGYVVSRDGDVLGSVEATSYVDATAAPETTYTYSVVAFDEAGNISPASSGSVSTPPIPGGEPLPTIRVNAGGPAYTDSFGHTWAADFGYSAGKPSADSATVTGTTDPQLFKTLRFDEQMGAPDVVYTFTVPNGTYLVRLLTAETSGANKAPGKRVFDIDIQGARAFEDVDIFVLASGGNKALVLESETAVTNGQIAIRFVPQVNLPRVHAIEIVPAGEPPPPPPADTQPPSAPGTLAFSDVTATSVKIDWSAATDNVGVTEYQLLRDGVPLTTVTGLTFTDTGLTAATTYNYSVVARDAAGNTSAPSSGTIATASGSEPLATLRINAGGSSYVDSLGQTWAADTGYNTGTAKSWPTTLTVAGTTEQTLFRSERYDPAAAPELSYTFNVPNGDYLVRLFMAETYPNTSGPGLRVFDVDLQGIRRFEDVDIYSAAGGANQVLVLQSPETVSGGTLTIDFHHQVENPKVNAIEIVPAP